MPPNPPRPAAGGAPRVAAISGSQAAPKLNDGAPPVNRKKQKKRQNQAARRAAEQQPVARSVPVHAHTHLGNGTAGPQSPSEGVFEADIEYERAEIVNDYESREGEVFYSDEESHP